MIIDWQKIVQNKMASSSPAAEAIPAPEYPLLQRMKYFLQIHILKDLISIFLAFKSLPGIRANTPTSSKKYENGLRNRVFIPKSWKTGDAPLPLYLSIHGGGFTICSPTADDRFCDEFCNNHNILVVSLNYPKAPTHPFPGAAVALTSAVKAVLNDKTLPFDRSKVALGGFSAGGNLALAVAQ